MNNRINGINGINGINKIWVLIIIYMLSGCQTTPPSPYDFIAADLYGKIYDTFNRACDNVQIFINGQDTDFEYTTVSDINGKFVVPSLPKGSYLISAMKAGYEISSSVINFRMRSQILYIKLVAVESLIIYAEEALDRKESQQAFEFLQRALVIAPVNPVALYLLALNNYRCGKWSAAQDILLEMQKLEYHYYSVYLLMADINQYFIRDLKTAKDYLLYCQALTVKHTIEQRISRIETILSKGETYETEH